MVSTRYAIAIADLANLMRHIESRIDLVQASKGPQSYWASIPLCVIDSVWSIRSQYYPTVIRVVERWCKSNQPPWAGDTSVKPTLATGPTLLEFVGVLEHRLRSGVSYGESFGNQQRTSSRNGILKAEAVHLFAKALLLSGINTFDDVRDPHKVEQAEVRVKLIKGQGSGITFKYFLMLCGVDDYVKPDAHVRRFVSDALLVDWKHLVTPERAEELVKCAAREFAIRYPSLTPASLDYAIWNYQKGRNKPACS